MAADVGNVPPTSGQPTIIRANTETGKLWLHSDKHFGIIDW